MSFSKTEASINSNNFRIIQSFVPEMSGRSIYDGAQWVNLQLLHGNNLVLKQTPLFVIVEISNGEEDFSFAHLQKGIKKEAYGDLLESFDDVKNFCDTFKFKGKRWKLGYYEECDYKLRNLTASTPAKGFIYSLLFCVVSLLFFVK